MYNRTDHQRTKEQNPSLNDQAQNSGSNVEKNPDDWVTGDEPMTDPQRSYLNTLSREAGEGPVENLTKAEASKKIEELQQKTGRGTEENY